MQVARRNRAEPDAGRHLYSWLRQAGFAQEEISYLPEVYLYSAADKEARRGWGEGWAERCVSSAFGTSPRLLLRLVPSRS